MTTKLPHLLLEMIDTADTELAVIPPTLVYNEGWMLRLLLALSAQGVDCFPFSFESGSRWFSEALLYSAFEPRFRGDRVSEAKTHADGVVGQFVFSPGSKSGLALVPETTQFIVLEAKMFATLSKGTKNAHDFDQAARSIACMAETLRRANLSVDKLASVGFYVVAPEAQISIGLFTELVRVESVRRKIGARIEQYDGVRRAQLDTWRSEFVEPLLAQLHIEAISWESILSRVVERAPAVGPAVRDFYAKSLRYNAAAVAAQASEETNALAQADAMGRSHE